MAPSLTAAITTRRTGDGVALELEELLLELEEMLLDDEDRLLELEELLLELDGGPTELDDAEDRPDELLPGGSALALLTALLAEGRLLLDSTAELELRPGIVLETVLELGSVDERPVLLDGPLRLELPWPGTLLELWPGPYDELKSWRRLLLLCPPPFAEPPLPPSPHDGGHCGAQPGG